MGLVASGIQELFEDWGPIQARILMLGLDAAGKSTILYKIKRDRTVCTIPTLGFNVETINPVEGITFTVWDVAGKDKIRSLWKHFFENCDDLVYVIDSADHERISEATDALFSILNSDEMRSVPVIILANKQDLPGALNTSQIVEQFHLNGLRDRKWSIQAVCGTSGEGIYEGMHKLATMVKNYKNKQSEWYCGLWTELLEIL